MIQQIVARRDGGEHLAYRARRRLRITGAHRSSADDWGRPRRLFRGTRAVGRIRNGDRKSTRLNSSHSQISYAVFCLKKKNNENMIGRDIVTLCGMIRQSIIVMLLSIERLPVSVDATLYRGNLGRSADVVL